MAGPSKKPILTTFKLQLPAGKATPAPPVGPVLSQHGLNIMEFVNQFNKATAKMEDGMIIPTLVTVYKDATFHLKLKSPPVSYLIKKAAGIMKGSGEPNKTKVGRLSKKQVEEIFHKANFSVIDYYFGLRDALTYSVIVLTKEKKIMSA